jgi:hypothetical protein
MFQSSSHGVLITRGFEICLISGLGFRHVSTVPLFSHCDVTVPCGGEGLDSANSRPLSALGCDIEVHNARILDLGSSDHGSPRSDRHESRGQNMIYFTC